MDGGAVARAKGKRNCAMKVLKIDGLKTSGTTVIAAEKVFIGAAESNELIDKIREFDLANSSPLMCYDFLRTLKEEL